MNYKRDIMQLFSADTKIYFLLNQKKNLPTKC